jgi:anti-sigma B factor antagonist
MDHDDDALVITVAAAERRAVIAVAGQLDIATSEQLEEVVADVLSDGQHSLVFDLAEVEFIDSSGLAVLLGTRRGNEPLTIRRPSETVQRLLQAAGLLDVVRVER